MDKLEEVKKIIEEYGCNPEEYSLTAVAKEICQLFDAECQDRVERIFKEIERKGHWTEIEWVGDKVITPIMGLQIADKDWQALKSGRK